MVYVLSFLESQSDVKPETTLQTEGKRARKGKKKKIAMLFPDFEGTPLEYRRHIHPLGLLALAAITPEDFEVSFIDERVAGSAGTLDALTHADVIAISAMTPQAYRAYEVADSLREMKIPVVLGGPHASLVPEEASAHADAVVIGEAEGVWAEALGDVISGKSRGHYLCVHKPSLSGIPRPRYDLLDDNHYLPIRSVQMTRGCPLNCEFCSVPKNFGREYRVRPADEIMEDLALLPPYIYFVDDNIMLKMRSFTKIFQDLKPLKKRWTGMAPLSIAGNEKYISLIADSGCWSLYVDMGPWISMGFRDDVTSLKNQLAKSIDLVARLNDHGIKVMGSFLFGFDHDDESVFDRALEFLEKSKIAEAEFLILTPYPNTPFYHRLESQGRIISKDWSLYNTTHAVYIPKTLSPERLEEGVGYLWREFFKRFDKRGDISETIEGVPDEIYQKVLRANPALFRDIVHNTLVEGMKKRRMANDETRDGLELLVSVWKERVPPVFTKLIEPVLLELGYPIDR